MQLRLFLLFIGIIAGQLLQAQKGSIEGQIEDAATSTPINGATVNMGNGAGYNTDLFGRFRFSAVEAGQYELVVSHIGYRTVIVPVEVKPALSSSVSIRLKKAELSLSEVRINSKRNNALSTLSAVDIKLRPLNSSQDVLRMVPGLFIAQHAGGGKAEQIFLRGFDIDHGTDIAISADGLPVNMVSHAHGQGYADLHFLIPETIGKVNFDKGPYQAAKGNLATAAWVDFNTRDFLEENMLKAEAGAYGTRRIAGMYKLFDHQSTEKKEQFYLAAEYLNSDGYFDSPQRFHRSNFMGKYNSWWGKQTQLSILAGHFSSRWYASGQIPDRAVQSGAISRWGAIDDTEGGDTRRSYLSIRLNKHWKNNWTTTDQFYFIRYQFNLFSNFSFFLDDPVNGDMINQREKRNTWGYTTTAAKNYQLAGKDAGTVFGAGFRYDDVMDIELSKATRQQFFNSIQKGDLKESNVFAWVNQELELGKGFSLHAALRYDHFGFRYRDALTGASSFSGQSKGILSPKLQLQYRPGPSIQFYLNNGIGFHSNDTRVILDQDARDILPKVFGTDLGMIYKPIRNLILKTAIWHLYSEQEFVYVGDAGIVEPGGKTRRMGVDVSARYELKPWLFADLDLNLTKARSIEEPKGENYVPLAPAFTSIGGITAKTKKGFSASLRYRMIGKRPANEDYSVTAEGYLLLDAVLNYRIKKFDFMLSGENLLNRHWREAQFETLSRLRSESVPVSEIHYTPGTPLFIKGAISFYF